MLHVIEYFMKSFGVIQNHTLEYGMCKSLLVFHCNYIAIYCIALCGMNKWP